MRATRTLRPGDGAARAVASAAALAVWLSTNAPAFAEADAVVRVTGPNTVKLDRLGTVTLAGSYTPKRLPGCFAYDPAAALRRTLPPKTSVEVTVFPGKGSTTLAWVLRSKDGLSVQTALVEGGWAEAAKLGSSSSNGGAFDARLASLRELQDAAKRKRVGLWVDCEEVAAAAAGDTAVDLDTQFEPLAGSAFEYGRVCFGSSKADSAHTCSDTLMLFYHTVTVGRLLRKR
jgi:endonuclease YncB( thermonuclease family)